MMKSALIPSCCLVFLLPGLSVAESSAELRKEFADPPIQWASRPLWFWNGKLDADKTRTMVSACKEAGYYGMGILPSPKMGVEFMSAEFLDHYQVAVDQAAKLGMKMCLYDEFWFPSGAAGGLLAKQHPEALSRRLDMLAVDVEGPKEVTAVVPAGTFMGAVAMNTATHERKNITAQVKEGKLLWQAPPGAWKVMLFTCVRDGGKGLINFLDPEAVKGFIDLTYQAYHDKFPQHFGKTIDSAFYDEPGLYHVQGGRAWLDSFNERFQERFGYDPLVHYPALFFESIGPDTAAARNALFGMRAELYTTGFPKTINDWCRKHDIKLTGHVDQEELVNPVIGQSGDLIKAFKYQDKPGIDQVFAYGRASRAYKVVSSSAYNYGKSRVVTECYGGIDLPVPNLYKEAMDQFAKGINLMVPHAVWYDEKTIVYKPNLTPGDARYGPELKEYNRYIGRLQRLLHSGRQVADIGVLYPIATLQAGSWFGPGNPYEGCVAVPEADYMNVGEMLSQQVRRDFNFVHPEVLDETCTVKGSEIYLQTASHQGRYQVFIIPGSRAIHWSNLKKIKEFYDQGGTVIATTQLPSFSAEFGKDKQVRETIEAMFGVAMEPRSALRVSASSKWAGGGHDPANATDGNPQTRWNAADGAKDEQWLEVDFGAEKTFQKTVVREAFNRAKQYRIQAWVDGKWNDCATGAAIGAEKTDTFTPVTATKVRLVIGPLDADSVSITEFEILDAKGHNLASTQQSQPSSVTKNAKGGRAYFILKPDAKSLKAALDEAVAAPDVAFQGDVATVNGNLTYIHKVVDGRSVYFIGNSSDKPVDTSIRLRGKLNLEWWDPHTGETRACETETDSADKQPVTRVKLHLDPVRSVFLMQK